MLNDTVAYLLGLLAIIIWQIIAFFTKQPIGKNILVSLFLIYLSGVLAITLFPLIYDVGVVEKMPINMIPFTTITALFKLMFFEHEFFTPFLQIVGNIILAIPYGVILPFLIKEKKWWKFLIFSPMLSISIELIQLILGLCTTTMYRTVDIDDVILNTLGTWIGIGIYCIFPQFIKEFFSKPKKIH